MLSIGYAQLIQRLNLLVRPLAKPAFISGSVNRRVDAENKVLFPPGVALVDTLVGHLEFALRHEELNLEVIEAAFEHILPADLVGSLQTTPTGEHIRRACFLWEWLTKNNLPTGAIPAGAYVDLLSPVEYLTSANARRHPRFRVRDNTLGSPDFCPVVRREAMPKGPSLQELMVEVEHLLAAVEDRELYSRAVQYFYLSETRGSYALEKETPSAGKQERFVQILRRAEDRRVVDEDFLVELQNAVVRDSYSQEASYRTKQNWLENGTGQITFLPPPPTELRRAMVGWEAFVNDSSRCTDVLVKAACAAFGFVYLHPFMDGNGRLHRFLIHHTLARSGLLAPGAILPVSAVILNHVPAYQAVLTAFSRPVTALWDYRQGDNDAAITRSPGSRPYRFFDASREVSFLYEMIHMAVRDEIPRELAWLRGYDHAFATLDRELDLPQKDLSALIRMAHSNHGKLSANRRKQFPHLPEAVMDRIEALVQDVFAKR